MLQHVFQLAGHEAFFCGKSLVEFKMDVERVASLARPTEADAWVVNGATKEVLEWFIGQRIKVFALFGRRRGLPIAADGPDKVRVFPSPN